MTFLIRHRETGHYLTVRRTWTPDARSALRLSSRRRAEQVVDGLVPDKLRRADDVVLLAYPGKPEIRRGGK